MGKIVVSYWWTKINPLIYKGFLVRETGLEPASSYEHMNLNHARLPIPPFPQDAPSRRREGLWWAGMDSNHRSL